MPTLYDQGEHGNLGSKEPGRHRWIAIATYALTDDMAKATKTGEGQIYLDHENRIGLHIGCLDCEEVYETAETKACPAPGFDWKGKPW